MSVYNLGLCYFYEGERQLALKQFKRAVRLGYTPAREWVVRLRNQNVKQLTEKS